uniref:DEP domain-containing protein 1B-like isoform X2 n=1 Tax=Myxine glutinosa TaxID=7769 RepID=UPI00358E8294
MDANPIPAAPYRATRMWNEIVTSFRNSVPRRRHRQGLRTYPASFTAGEATTWLLAHLSTGTHFGPDVSRGQALRLLCKFLQTHVIEDVKGRWGSENFADDNHLYRFPRPSPMKRSPKRPILTQRNSPWLTSRPTSSLKAKGSATPCSGSRIWPRLKDWPKRHSVAAGDEMEVGSSISSFASPNTLKRHSMAVPQAHHATQQPRMHVVEENVWKTTTLEHLQITMELKSLTGLLNCAAVDPKHIMHNVSVTNKQGVVLLHNKHDELPSWVISAMKCLANWPKHNSEVSSYPGFEKDVFQTIAEFFQNLKEPLIPYPLYELIINVLGVLSRRGSEQATEALQLSSLLLPPASRRRLQLLLRLLGRISRNQELFSMLCPSGLHIRDMLTRTFWSCVLRSPHTSHLDELLAYRLLSFLLEHYEEVLRVPTRLRAAAEARLFQLRHQQPCSSGVATSSIMQPSYSFCRQITVHEFQEQAGTSSHTAIKRLLESISSDQNMDPRLRTKHLKQFQKAYPDIYRQRFGALDEGPQPLAERRGLGDSVHRRPCQVQRKSSLRWQPR